MFFWWDFVATLGAMLLIVDLASEGFLPIWIATPMLVVFVIFRAFARSMGGIKGCIYYPFTIFFFGILIFLVALKGGLQDMIPILIGTFYGGLEKILAQIGKLASEGHISIYLAVLLCFGLVFLRWLGLQRGSTFIYYLIFNIGAPIFIFLTFLATASRGNWREAVMIGGSLMALLVILEGFYIMFYGFFSSVRRR